VFFVEARYHRDPSRAGAQVRYIAHREEGLTDGRPRDLYGIGERYRALRGDEPAIRTTLREDALGLRSPVYFRFILTVDDYAAKRFAAIDGYRTERLLRDAVQSTFRGALRGAQGVFAIHQHGGIGRPSHPHVHALLSPRFENRMAVHISPLRIQRVRERWEREILAGLQRHERRLQMLREPLPPLHEHRPKDQRTRRPKPELLPSRPAYPHHGQLELLPLPRRRRLVRRGEAWTRGLVPFGRSAARWERHPERAARRAVFQLASRAMPRAFRDVIRLLRGLRERQSRER
jgi:hypothetical protein